MTAHADGLSWANQSSAARAYVASVVALGAVCAVALLPTALPRPVLFVSLLAASCVTSIWKVNLPIPLASGSTLSLSYAANLTSLLLLGPRAAMVIALAGVWLQCTVNVVRPYPRYRTLFSIGAEAVTMAATGLAYVALGGPHGSLDAAALAKPLVGAIGAYFVVNTGLVAGAIALTTGRTAWNVWRDEFQWSGASFIVAGTAGAIAAVVIDRGNPWAAVLMVAPVYLTYRSYRLFVGRLEEQRRYGAESERLHQEAIAALTKAQAAERALADAHRVKDQFLAIVSHELRTPLNAVLGWSEMLQQGQLDPSRQARAFRAIYDGARRQVQLIEDLLDVSRIMSGKLRLTRAPVDVRDVVRAALEVVQPAADAKRIRVAVTIDPAVGSIQADAARLQQVVWNLLANAIKFTSDDGRVDAAVRRAGRFVEITVSDTGQGIPADFLKVIFEPFRQADASTTRVHGGLGLGLAIVRHLVEAHGGTIRAESGGEGRGATFTVRLPAVAADALAGFEPPALPPNRLSSSGALRDVRVLIVDDDADSREVAAVHLEAEGATVIEAASAEAAYALVQQDRFDLLLVDIAMPGEDGFSFLRRVRSEESAAALVPAIALTAFVRPEDRQQSKQAGFDMHLAKPVERATLVDAVLSVAKLSAA